MMTIPYDSDSMAAASEPSISCPGSSPQEPEDLMESIKIDSDYFKKMINLVPPQFYFDQDTRDKLSGQKGGKQGNKGKGKKRGNDSDELSDKAKWKRVKYDPNQVQTVTSLQERLDQHVSDDEEEDDSEGPSTSTKHKQKPKMPLNHTSHMTVDSEELRERLQAKIDSLQEKRKAMSKGDMHEKRKLQRKESKLKSKLMKQTKKQNKMKERAKADLNGIGAKNKQKTQVKPIYNKEGKMVFSKFDFSNRGEDSKKSDVPSGKNYKKLLETIQKQKQKINELKETDADAAKQLKDKTAWQAALQKAEGVKVKDNPELVKKSIKKKEALKKKSSKQWDERQTKLDKKMKDKQDKRKKNIQAKKQKNVDKKISKAKKKGRILPGF